MNRNNFLSIVCLAAIMIFASATISFADDPAPERIRIVAAYGGVITNKFSKTSQGYTIEHKGSGFMTGVYAQWIETDLLQGNFFGYWSPDVNYSKVWGLHGNLDGYFMNSTWGSLVAGIDIENINIRTDAGSHLTNLNSFTMDNNILFGMVRGGARFKVQPVDSIAMTIFPYIGATHERVKGEIYLDTAGPFPPPMIIDILESDNYLSWGVNLNIRAFHFIDLTLKYLGRAQKDNYMNSGTAQLNWYLSRMVALSYQYKYMQLSDGYDQYHLLGAGIVF